MSTDTQCVVLNGCFSNAQASALVETIPTAVGLSSQVSDTAAIAFATGFYEVLALGRSVDEAFKAACIRVARTQLESDRETPKLLHSQDVEPRKVTLFPTKTTQPTVPQLRRPPAASVPAQTPTPTDKLALFWVGRGRLWSSPSEQQANEAWSCSSGGGPLVKGGVCEDYPGT